MVFNDARTCCGTGTALPSGEINASPCANWKTQCVGGSAACANHITRDLSLAWPCGAKGLAFHCLLEKT